MKKLFSIFLLLITSSCFNTTIYENVEYTSGLWFYKVFINDIVYQIKVENVYNLYLNHYKVAQDNSILYNDFTTKPLRLCIYNYDL